jgi:hypothetical protein
MLVFLLSAAGFVGFVWWDRGAPPGVQPPTEPVAVAELTRNHRGVRVEGTAHYSVKLVQTAGDETWYLFPLFPPGDTAGRDVTVVVRTQRKPGELYSFEDLVVEGLARPPGTLMPRSTQDQLTNRGYTFSPDFVLVEEFEAPAPDPG